MSENPIVLFPIYKNKKYSTKRPHIWFLIASIAILYDFRGKDLRLCYEVKLCI